MTRDEAVVFLTTHGVRAERRTWAMGDTIQVLVGAARNYGGITAYEDILWLLEDGAPPRWYLVRFINLRDSRTEFGSLAEACVAALELSRPAEPMPDGDRSSRG
jgi:hypothetical protein